MTHVSTSAHTIRAKDPERDQLQADIDAFLAKPGNAIEVVPSGESSQPLQITYREGMSRFTAMDNAVKTNRAERTGKPAPQPPATPTSAPKKKTRRPAKET